MKTTFLSILAIAAFGGGAPAAHASVQVHGEATSNGPSIRVQVFANITSPAIVSHSFKLFYPAGRLEVVSATRNDAAWYFHDGTRAVLYAGPDTSRPGEILFTGGRMDARSPSSGVIGNGVLLGTVEFRRLTQNQEPPGFDVSIGRAGQFASFVTVNGTVLEAQPGMVTWQPVGSDPEDQDLDGLTDRWEEDNFGTTKGIFYSDDPDRDGVNNQGEEAMGTDPTDPRSLLRLSVVDGREALVLEWPSVDGRRYTLEAAKRLGRFEPIQEGIAATPPRNQIELKWSELAEIQFFRVRVDRVERR